MTRDFFVKNGLKVQGNTLLNGSVYTDSACTKLHVKTANNGALANLSNTQGLLVENSGSSDSNYILKLASGCGNIFNVTNSGKIGLFTTTPNERLTVVGNISATGFLYGDGSNLTNVNADTVDNYHACQLYRCDADFTTSGNLIIQNTSPKITLRDTDGTCNTTGTLEFQNSVNTKVGSIGFDSSSDDDLVIENNYSTGDICINTNGSNRIFVENTGNVGIGTSQPSYKLEVNGTAHVTGEFTAGTKSFLIDHPTKEHYMIQYGSLEGPEYGVYVRGTNSGSIIILPEYWRGLVDEDTITVTLTPRNSYSQLYVKCSNNEEVHIGGADLNTIYDYVVNGTRKDVEKLTVEFETPQYMKISN